MSVSRVSPHLALATYDQAPQLYPDDHGLRAALERHGVRTTAVVWDDPAVDWSAFDAVLIRSIWDYFRKYDAYLAWLTRLQALAVPTLNSWAMLRWNADKRYLLELAALGVAIPPTRLLQGAELSVLAREPGEWVVKPAVSGGAWLTVRGHGGDPAFASALAQLPTALDFLVQPCLPEIAESGEWSLLYFGGVYSHAVLKRPAAGEFRVQSQFGGTTARLDPPQAARDAAQRVLALSEQRAGASLCYARVDGVMVAGEFLLMELEAIEPFLFLDQHAPAAQQLADVLACGLKPRAQAA